MHMHNHFTYGTNKLRNPTKNGCPKSSASHGPLDACPFRPEQTNAETAEVSTLVTLSKQLLALLSPPDVEDVTEDDGRPRLTSAYPAERRRHESICKHMQPFILHAYFNVNLIHCSIPNATSSTPAVSRHEREMSSLWEQFVTLRAVSEAPGRHELMASLAIQPPSGALHLMPLANVGGSA